MLNNLEGVEDADVDGASANYIVGKESINWEGESQDAIRFDIVAEFTMTYIQEIMGVSLKCVLNMELVEKHYLIENIGMVKSSANYIIDQTASGVVDGQSMIILMTITQDMDITLTSYSLGDLTVSRYTNSNSLENFEADIIKNIYSDKIDLKSLFQIVRGIIH